MSRHDPITTAHLDLIKNLARQLGISASLLVQEIDQRFRCLPNELNRGEASALIDWLTAVRDGHGPRPVPPGQLAMFGGDGLR